MSGLAARRPVFHSEADLQFAFAWQLKLHYPAAHIRLETRPRRDMRLDILTVLGGRRVAFELKYLVTRLTAEYEGEVFELPSQAAHDIRRYDFVKDISRLESLLDGGLADLGFALLLTNDANHWRACTRVDVADAAFRLTEGRSLSGSLGWATSAGSGTIKGREEPIVLHGAYELAWRPFGSVGGKGSGEFRYLLVSLGVLKPKTSAVGKAADASVRDAR